jgi:UDP-2,4-diacetamido-2,4,6-trideoxy-beta-L-altropyranose hydrolase
VSEPVTDALDQSVIFRADATQAIGGGHVARCLALAEALTARGARCAFAVSAESRATVPALGRFAGPVFDVPPETAPARESEALARRFPEGADWLVVDHYERDAAFEQSCRSWARRILVIDDLADRPHDCDILLDQTSAARGAAYRSLVPPDCRLLVGPAYALLRPSFAQRRRFRSPRVADKIGRVFVSFGAVDARDHCSMALAALGQAGLAASVDVVIGSAAPHRSNVERAAAAVGFPVAIHTDVADMAALMAQADLAIGAAGVTSWERCVLGLPSIVVVAANNQRLAATELRARGAAVVLGEGDRVSAPDMAAAVQSLAVDASRRKAMSAAALAACDGLGAGRVAAALLPALHGTDGAKIDLRPATLDDADLLLRWQADPNTRRFARNSAVPDPATHRAWVHARLGDPACLLNIVLSDGAPAGALRLDHVPTADQLDRWEVSIYVDPARYRRGLAKAALALARRLLPEALLVAEVLPGNAASHALFTAAGYVMIGGRYEQRPGCRHGPASRTVAS